MKKSIVERGKHNGWHRRDERIARLGVSGLIKYLRSMLALGQESAIFDFGCGYFDAGLAIVDRVGRIDGFDVDPISVAAARRRTEALADKCAIYDRLDDVPRGTYDLIIAHSVFQYLRGDDEVLDALRVFRSLLRRDGAGVALVSDIIPPDFSSIRDAFRDLWAAAAKGLVFPMVIHLYRSAFQSKGVHHHRISVEAIIKLADEAGFTCRQLDRNFTSSRQRHTCLLTVK